MGTDLRRAALRDALLSWYAAAGRELPWRRHPDPYAVLVSEVMLQQTQVARVLTAFVRFLRAFPSVGELAAAGPDEVLRAWGGLGYNRRAVHLHRAARAIVERHGGRVPCDVDDLRALPGVGEYTARAVAAFAFGRDEAPVDTNVARVLARAVAGETLSPRAAQALADELLPARQASDWGQALMDLGSAFCTARSPRCGDCPVGSLCAWRSGDGQDPGRPARPATARPFRESDRYHRGRIVAALRGGPVPVADLAGAADLADEPRLSAIVDGLVAEGLVEREGVRLRLPVGR